MSAGTVIQEKVVPKIMAFVNTKGMRALKDGILYSMPMILIGAVFMLIANFPVPAFTAWLQEIGLAEVCNQMANSSFGIIAIISAVGIAYTYVKNEGYAGLPAGIISLCCFLILCPSTVETADGSVGVILKDWTGGKGMIGAIAAGLLVGWIYSIFMNKKITIKMPDSVPEGVTNAFSSLIPGLVLVFGSGVIFAVCKLGFDKTPIEIIYTWLQAPLQGLTDSFGGAVAMGLLIPFLWFFGVHGSTIIGDAVMGPLLLANSADNQAIIDSGKALTLANGAHIVTKQFLDQCIIVSGAGITIGLVLCMLLFARSTQLKSVGKLGIVPAVFNINEPVLFGVPIVLNPILLVPFMVVPTLAAILEYICLRFGLIPLYTGVMVPWTTPAVISGFLVGDWRTAVFQAVIILLSTAIYYPFFKVLDKRYYEQETGAASDAAQE